VLGGKRKLIALSTGEKTIMSTKALEAILARLGDPKKVGDGYTSRSSLNGVVMLRHEFTRTPRLKEELFWAMICS
jgi:hypothetical protein